MTRIFLSYRRQDSAMAAGRIYDHLVDHFGESSIFMDVDDIEPGEDFVDVLEKAVGSCDVLLAVIGREWLIVTDNRGKRRLDNAEDFVRIEILTALNRNVRVIPLLVNGADILHAEDLPPEMLKLARLNALPITNERFRSDLGKLKETIEKVLAASPKTTAAPAIPQKINLTTEQKYIEFWTGLLKKTRERDIKIFTNKSPGKRHWIQIGAGITGLFFSCSIRRYTAGIELYIDTGEQSQNKAIFDVLYKNRESIEAEFGNELEWRRLEDKRASRILKIYDEKGGLYEPEKWDSLQDLLIDEMVKFDQAFRKRLKNLES